MSDRPCPQCIWHGVDGCTNWDCEPVTRSEARKRLHGWTSVIDRLPANDDHVLCCTRTKSGMQNIVIGYYMDGMWRCGMNSNVTHWMPLPDTPEEGDR